MVEIAQLARTLKKLLTVTAEDAAVRSRWYKRQPKKLTGAVFCQGLVLGWLGKPEASLGQLSQSLGSLGIEISAQGLEQRFNSESAEMMRLVLLEATRKVFAAEPVAVELLRRFAAVAVADSSTVVLPPQLESAWKGCGSGTGRARAALKLYVRLDLESGALSGPLLTDGRNSDRNSPLEELELPQKALQIEDLGFFDTEQLGKLDQRGVYWLTRLQSQCALYDPVTKQQLELFELLPRREAEVVELPVLLGAKHKLPARLIALRVPAPVAAERRRRLRVETAIRRKVPTERRLSLCDWTILVTSVPQEMLSPQEAMVLVRSRWQIERLFRLWKQDGLIDEWRSTKPWRILTELYAKLLGVLIQHWSTLTCLWEQPARSLVKAAQTVRQHASLLLSAFHGALPLRTALEQIRCTLRSGCKLDSRRKFPSTSQLLSNPELLDYFELHSLPSTCET